jgi:uncharacterized membrane protein YczE
MDAAPTIRGGLAARSALLLVGFVVFALGIVLTLESKLGLSPWDVLNQGIARHTPLSFGLANVAVALLVLGVSWRLGARIGAGTVANAVLIGVFVDLLLRIDTLQRLGHDALLARAGMLTAGIAGPRDSLMLVLSSRTRWRVGIVRAAVESAATALGFAMGGTVGVGTIAFALSIGPVVEASFWVLLSSPLAAPVPAPAT